MGYIPTALPDFSYTGAYTTELRADWGWVIRFKSSGTLTFTGRNRKIDVFLVGGGGGGTTNTYSETYCGGGGGGGHTTMKTDVSIKAQKAYSIVVGSGGTSAWAANDGGASTAFGLSAAGGKGAKHTSNSSAYGGDGGSGGGYGGENDGYAGGSNGGNGSGTHGGTGEGVSTCEFRTAGWPLYAGGGGGGRAAGGAGGGGDGGYRLIGGSHTSRPGKDGAANTGGGGGGAGPQGNDPAGEHFGGKGGSGIVCIRNSASDVLPVVFNGTWLTRLVHNGTDVTSLIYDGTKLFMRALRRRRDGCGRTRRNACTWAGWKSAEC